MKNINYSKILFILFASLVLAFVFNAVASTGIPVNGKLGELEKNVPAVAEIDEIDTDAAYEYYKKNIAVFIDARDGWDFDDSHIKGAVNVPEYKTDVAGLTKFNFDKNKLYIIYCNSSDCGTSKKLADKMFEAGFTDLLVYSEGWDAWKNKGLPVE